MPAKSRKPKQSTKPTFVFKGTVQRIKSATMKQVPVDDRTVIATVDQILEAPQNLAKLAGQKITVRLSGRQKVKPGQEMIFHTISWIYGDSVAVQAISQEPVKASHMSLLGAVADPVEQHHQRVKRERFDQADLVVSGKVLAVRLPGASSPTQKMKGVKASVLAQPTTTARKPVSEHDPKWREAVVEVGDVHKGTHKQKQVVVRFPASTDVMWYHAPKFQPGQQGFFMLHKPQARAAESKGARKPAKKGEAAALIAPEVGEPDVYTALDAADFQPFNEPGGVKTLIESASDKNK